MLKFYQFTQNNSGGSFESNDKVCHRIIIEANNEDEAIYKAESLGCYWNGVSNGNDCECCGDRWYCSPNEINIKDYNENGYSVSEYSTNNIEAVREKYKEFSFIKEPEVITKKYGKTSITNIEASVRLENIEQYAQLMANLYGGWTKPDTRIFYHNDTVAEFL